MRAIGRRCSADCGGQIGSSARRAGRFIRPGAAGEIPPVATVRILTAQLENNVATDLVAARRIVCPGVAKCATALGARHGIRHRGVCLLRTVGGWNPLRERAGGAKRYKFEMLVSPEGALLVRFGVATLTGVTPPSRHRHASVTG